MKLKNGILTLLIILFFVPSCKVKEEVPRVANYYKPVFDQTKKKYNKVPGKAFELDTTVLIRSNIRDKTSVFRDTIDMSQEFVLDFCDLAVPVEAINAKPPTYDTLVVVKEIKFSSDYVDLLFPVLPDSMLKMLHGIEASPSEPDSLFLISEDQMLVANDSLDPTEHLLVADSVLVQDTTAVQETPQLPAADLKDRQKRSLGEIFSSVFGNKEAKQRARSRKLIDRNLGISDERKQAIADSIAGARVVNSILRRQDSIRQVIGPLDSLVFGEDLTLFFDSILLWYDDSKVDYFTRSFILADSTRDLYDAENILDDLVEEAPFQLNDSARFNDLESRFVLDSVVRYDLDTVLVEVFDSSKVILQYAWEELTNCTTDTIFEESAFIFKDTVTFRIFYPDEDDVFVEMVRVEGGEFKIGSNVFDEDERPAYNLRISRFLMSKNEVSNKLFCYFLNDLRCDSLGYINGNKVIDIYHPATQIRRNHNNGKFFPAKGLEDYPVVNVTWVGANMFCMGANGRLPSEAEWEYAAKGGKYAKKYFIDRANNDYEYVNRFSGSNYVSEVGWFVDNSGGRVWVGGRKKPNELGIYDMSGNVWEWCYDQYDKTFYKTNGKSRDPICQGKGIRVRVNRGGSWSSDASYCRVTNRNFLNQYQCNPYLGFRYMREWR